MSTNPNDPNAAINRRFDLLRQRQMQQGNQVKQQASEDIQRQAASRGRLGSGLTQKLQNQAQEQIDQGQNQALEGIEAQRDQSLFQQAEADTARKFAAEQAALGRQFSREERLGGQEFAAGQAQKQMEYATAERLGAQGFQRELFDANAAWQKKVFNKQNEQWLKQFNEASRQFDKQYDLDFSNSEFNKMMAEKQFNKKDLLEKIENIAPLSVTKLSGMKDSGSFNQGGLSRSMSPQPSQSRFF